MKFKLHLSLLDPAVKEYVKTAGEVVSAEGIILAQGQCLFVQQAWWAYRNH